MTSNASNPDCSANSNNCWLLVVLLNVWWIEQNAIRTPKSKKNLAGDLDHPHTDFFILLVREMRTDVLCDVTSLRSDSLWAILKPPEILLA